jgi:hypothetical protein
MFRGYGGFPVYAWVDVVPGAEKGADGRIEDVGSLREVKRTLPLIVPELRSQETSGLAYTPAKYFSLISSVRRVGGGFGEVA